MNNNEYKAISEVIQKATKNALIFLGLSWRFQISHPYSEFQIDFYDGKPYQCDVHFDLPPAPDEDSITQLIIRLLLLKLDGNDNN